MDVHAIALKSLKSAIDIFLKDLEALPEEAFDRAFGGASRNPADIAYEVSLVNDHVGLTLRGEELFDWPEGWLRAPDDRRTKEAAIQGFEVSSQRILATVAGLPSDSMGEKVSTEHGETDRFERCRFMTLHLWYHAGQLNYIQTMLGDDAWHWN